MSRLLGRLFPWLGAAGGTPETLVVGLGNKGEEYRDTRHNVGFDVVDELRTRVRECHRRILSRAEVATGKLGGGRWIGLAKPLTYMNRSGEAVAGLLGRYRLPLSSCLVVVDDFNLKLGTVRFRRSGSDGGHNGLKSIIGLLGPEFPRLRIGIGPLPAGTSVVDYVLGRFVPEEERQKQETVRTAAEAVLYCIENGVAAAMNKYN